MDKRLFRWQVAVFMPSLFCATWLNAQVPTRATIDTTILANGEVIKIIDGNEVNYWYNLRVAYPARGREYSIEGDMTVTYSLDSDCSVQGVEFVNTLGEDFEKEISTMLARLSKLVKYYEPGTCESWYKTETISFYLPPYD